MPARLFCRPAAERVAIRMTRAFRPALRYARGRPINPR